MAYLKYVLALFLIFVASDALATPAFLQLRDCTSAGCITSFPDLHHSYDTPNNAFFQALQQRDRDYTDFVFGGGAGGVFAHLQADLVDFYDTAVGGVVSNWRFNLNADIHTGANAKVSAIVFDNTRGYGKTRLDWSNGEETGLSWSYNMAYNYDTRVFGPRDVDGVSSYYSFDGFEGYLNWYKWTFYRRENNSSTNISDGAYSQFLMHMGSDNSNGRDTSASVPAPTFFEVQAFGGGNAELWIESGYFASQNLWALRATGAGPGDPNYGVDPGNYFKISIPNAFGVAQGSGARPTYTDRWTLDTSGNVTMTGSLSLPGQVNISAMAPTAPINVNGNSTLVNGLNANYMQGCNWDFPCATGNGSAMPSLKLNTLSNLTGGISMTDTTANNLAGTVTISGASATTAPVTFGVAEVDTNYCIQLTSHPKSGSPPFLIPYYSNQQTTGFTINLSSAPGTGNVMGVDWLIIKGCSQ